MPLIFVMVEVSCIISSELADLLEGYLCEYVRCNWTLFNDRPGEPFYLRGFFDTQDEAQTAWAELKADLPELPDTPTWDTYEDRQWQDAYKEFLKPWSQDCLHWVPVWLKESYVVAEGHHALYFDAGMAFGTGAHETTRLMARRLLEARPSLPLDAPIIDAGTGSGILAISASLLGYTDVYGFDRDEESVRIAKENLPMNGLPEQAVAFEHCGLEAGLKGRQASFIFANIISEVLVIYAETLLKAVAQGGQLALSGILNEELEGVKKTFTEQAAKLWGQGGRFHSRSDGQWSDLLITRPDAAKPA
jgi:ribosomal protein L11 methyltransferase